MSSFGCCMVWFLIGALLGWLLNYWLCKCKNKPQNNESQYTPPPPAPAPAPVASVAATSAPVAAKAPTPAPAKAPTAKKPTAPKKKPATPKKVTAKPKAAPKKVAIDLAAAKAAGFKIKAADDLTVIEGIGPKINDLFKSNGLKTFDQVASAKVSEMRAILDKGGARYRIANPSTWAKQAKLAATNKWTALKKLQDELSGGVAK